MKYLLAAGLLLAQLLALPTALSVPAVRSVELQEPLSYACAVLDYDCLEISPPAVVYEPLFWPYGALGLFDPATPGLIHIDTQMLPYMDQVYVQAILAHELAHYAEFALTGELKRCQTEWNAWRVTNAWLVDHGRPDLADYAWTERYGCTGVE